MGQSVNYAAKKNAQIMLREEECASGMEEREFVGAKDVQNKLSEEECAGSMGRRIW